MYKYLHFGFVPRVDLLGHNSIFLIFRGTTIPFPTVAASLYIPTSSAQVSEAPQPHGHLLFSGFDRAGTLVGVKCEVSFSFNASALPTFSIRNILCI